GEAWESEVAGIGLEQGRAGAGRLSPDRVVGLDSGARGGRGARASAERFPAGAAGCGVAGPAAGRVGGPESAGDRRGFRICDEGGATEEERGVRQAGDGALQSAEG